MASSLSTDDRRELDDILARLVALEEKLLGKEESDKPTDADYASAVTGVAPGQYQVNTAPESQPQQGNPG